LDTLQEQFLAAGASFGQNTELEVTCSELVPNSFFTLGTLLRHQDQQEGAFVE
jgi:hypothetical protein